jgi:hypothetical protein
MKAFLALICSLGLVWMGPATAHAEGQKNQQQKRAPRYTGQAPAYHGAVGGAGHVNVPANRPGSTGKPTAVGKSTTVARQPGNKANKHKAEPGPQAVSTNAHRNVVIKSRTKSTISKNAEHPIQARTGSSIAGLPKWNFPTKSGPNLSLTPPPAVLKSVPAQNLFDAQRGVPSRLVTLAPMAPISSTPFKPKFEFPAITGLGSNIFPGPFKPLSRAPGLTPVGNPADGDSVEALRIPGQAHDPAGPQGPPGNPANGTSTMSTNQPVNMANNPPPTTMTSAPRNVVNEQGTSERAPAGQFQQNRRIQGSDQWVDSDYDVFRNYRSEWHDRDWWRANQSRIVFCVDGWYYWNGGYWFPAWGYDPEADYAYDGPIYAYKDWPPDQVTATVQGTLQKQGFYQGESNGLLGAPTSTALAGYQRTHGLYETSTIDRPTSQSLGMK